MLFIIRMTHTALTEPLEGEGYKFKQEDSGRPCPPPAPTHAALANSFFFPSVFVAFAEKTHSKSQTTGTKQRIFKRRGSCKVARSVSG